MKLSISWYKIENRPVCEVHVPVHCIDIGNKILRSDVGQHHLKNTPPPRESNDLGHIVFVSSVCLSVVNFNIRYNFWTMRDRDFIFDMHTPLMMPFQMKPMTMTLWSYLWPFLEILQENILVWSSKLNGMKWNHENSTCVVLSHDQDDRVSSVMYSKHLVLYVWLRTFKTKRKKNFLCFKCSRY